MSVYWVVNLIDLLPCIPSCDTIILESGNPALLFSSIKCSYHTRNTPCTWHFDSYISPKHGQMSSTFACTSRPICPGCLYSGVGVYNVYKWPIQWSNSFTLPCSIGLSCQYADGQIGLWGRGGKNRSLQYFYFFSLIKIVLSSFTKKFEPLILFC